MKKTFYLLGTLLLLMATGCQKENPINETFRQERLQNCQIIYYVVDGTSLHTTVTNNNEFSILIEKLLAMAQEGHSIQSIRNNASQNENLAKEVEHFQTKDAKEMAEWVQQMTDKGFKVDVQCIDGVYYGTATR